MSTPPRIRAVVFDWAGTIVDFGSLAPMGAFVELFARHGIAIDIQQARGPMGLPKLAHIEALGALPQVARQWEDRFGHPFAAEDARRLLTEFEPMSAKSALERSDFIPGFLEAMVELRARGIRVATTTGYTRHIMTPLIERARGLGFEPELVICCDDVALSRPSPLGMQACMRQLDVESAPHVVVKVDDTAPGLAEGLHAGCWTVGVAASGNALGWDRPQWDQASPSLREQALLAPTAALLAAGAHEVVPSVAELTQALDRIERRLANGERPCP